MTNLDRAGTNLDRLNELLKSDKLNLPDFRRKVDPSFRNLLWLKKALRTSDNQELKDLLNFPQHKLLARST